MSSQRLHAQLEHVFQDVFNDPTLQLTDDTTAEDIDAWDSLSHILLLFRVEAEFAIEFQDNETASLANVGALKSLLLAKGSQPA